MNHHKLFQITSLIFIFIVYLNYRYNKGVNYMSKNFKGIIGAFLGAILFSLPWILMYVYGGYILSLLAAIIASGSYFLYKKFGGIVTKKTTITISVCSIIAIILATYVFIPILLILKEYGYFNTNLYNQVLDNSEFITALNGDFAISILFTILGIAGVISSIKREAYIINSTNTTDELVTNRSLDEKINYLGSIYQKHNALTKKTAVSNNIILNELGKNYDLFNEFKMAGYIVLTMNKSYFDPNALNDDKLAKKHAKSNNAIRVYKLSIILILFLVIFLIIVLSPSDSSESNNKYNDSNHIDDIIPVSYKDIRIKIPYTFKLDTSYTEYKVYGTTSYDTYVYEVMLDQYVTNSTTDKETFYQECIKDFEKSFKVIEVESYKYSNINGYELFLSSIKYPDEYYYYYLLLDDNNNVYTIIYYTSVKDIDESELIHLQKFKSEAESYQKTLYIYK